MLRSDQLPRPVGQTGVAAWVALFVVYFGRLIALDPNSNVIRVAALVSGIVLVPAFYLQVGLALLGSSEREPA